MNSEPILTVNLTVRIEALLGEKLKSSKRVAGGGYTPALRVLCKTSSRSVFVKIATTPLINSFVRREIRVYQSISGDFMPRLIASEDDEQAAILIIEDLSARHWPPPWRTGDVDAVLRQLDAMHNTRAAIETFAEVHGGEGMIGGAPGLGWARVAADPKPFLWLGVAGEVGSTSRYRRY